MYSCVRVTSPTVSPADLVFICSPFPRTQVGSSIGTLGAALQFVKPHTFYWTGLTCRWDFIGRVLVFPLVALSAITLFVVGFIVGIVGVVVALSTGHTRLMTSGAQMIRSIDQLPFGLGTDRSHVYFISDEQGTVKIGISHEPNERLASLQTGHPEPLELLHAVSFRTSAEARMAESAMHHAFAEQRLNGEWFDLSDRQLRRAFRMSRRLR